jgi:hypothetical protein
MTHRSTHWLHITQIKTPEGDIVGYSIQCADDTHGQHKMMFHLQLSANTSLSGGIFHGNTIDPRRIPEGASFDNVNSFAESLYQRKMRTTGERPTRTFPHTDGKNLAHTKSVAISAQDADQLSNRVRMNLVAHNIAPERE